MAGKTTFKPEYVEQAKRLAAALGATDTETGAFFGVSERTIHKWKIAHPAFAKALALGKKVADARVVDSLYQRAVGFSHDAEEIFCKDGVVTRAKTVKKYPPDTVACIFWLKNRDKENWRDKQEIDHSSTDGSMRPAPPMTKEELREAVRSVTEKF